jgi:hypothetical protein
MERSDVNAVPAPRGAVFTLQSNEIERNWGLIAPHLERVGSDFPDDIDIPAILGDLIAARKQLWGYHDGIAITVIAVTEVQHPVCWLRVCVGTETWRGQIEAGLAAIEAWAKSIGCERVKLVGRMGWRRRLHSYRQIGIVLEKPL